MEGSWWNLREQFFRDHDISKLASCDHPDAKWLVSLGNPTSELLATFNDARSQCFRAAMFGTYDISADHPYAIARHADSIRDISNPYKKMCAKKAADAGEPLGMVVMGDCTRDLEAREWYRKAAKMGYIPGIYKYRKMKYERNNPLRYRKCSHYANRFPRQTYFDHQGGIITVEEDLQCRFELGRFCKWAEPVRLIWMPLIKRSINMWTICAKRLRLVKDIRILIAKKLWKNRHLWCNPWHFRYQELNCLNQKQLELYLSIEANPRKEQEPSQELAELIEAGLIYTTWNERTFSVSLSDEQNH